jgi:hypothetical protein
MPLPVAADDLTEEVGDGGTVRVRRGISPMSRIAAGMRRYRGVGTGTAPSAADATSDQPAAPPPADGSTDVASSDDVPRDAVLTRVRDDGEDTTQPVVGDVLVKTDIEGATDSTADTYVARAVHIEALEPVADNADTAGGSGQTHVDFGAPPRPAPRSKPARPGGPVRRPVRRSR